MDGLDALRRRRATRVALNFRRSRASAMPSRRGRFRGPITVTGSESPASNFRGVLIKLNLSKRVSSENAGTRPQAASLDDPSILQCKGTGVLKQKTVTRRALVTLMYRNVLQ